MTSLCSQSSTRNHSLQQTGLVRKPLTRRLACGVLAITTAVVSTGCASSKSSHTARTGAEQLLISSAIDRSLSRVQFSDFSGLKVFINDSYLEGVDKGYLVGSLRHGVLRNGGLIAGSADDADVVLEARSGGIGTDSQESFIGIPALGMPGLPIELPEIKIASRSTQMGTAKLGLVCYDAKTGEMLAEGGESTALTHDNDTYVFGVGPFKDGTIRQQRERAIGFNGVGGSIFAGDTRVARATPITMVRPKDGVDGLKLPFHPDVQIADRPSNVSSK